MNAGNEKPSTDEIEQKALAIGERLVKTHPAMQIKQVDVVDGVVLVGRVGVGLFSSYLQNNKA
jgi:hypothetical protein